MKKPISCRQSETHEEEKVEAEEEPGEPGVANIVLRFVIRLLECALAVNDVPEFMS